MATSVLPSPVFISAILPWCSTMRADQLHVEVAHLHGAPARLAHHRKRLGQKLLERLLLGRLDRVLVRNAFELLRNPRPKLNRLRAQLLIRELLASPAPEH